MGRGQRWGGGRSDVDVRKDCVRGAMGGQAGRPAVRHRAGGPVGGAGDRATGGDWRPLSLLLGDPPEAPTPPPPLHPLATLPNPTFPPPNHTDTMMIFFLFLAPCVFSLQHAGPYNVTAQANGALQVAFRGEHICGVENWQAGVDGTDSYIRWTGGQTFAEVYGGNLPVPGHISFSFVMPRAANMRFQCYSRQPEGVASDAGNDMWFWFENADPDARVVRHNGQSVPWETPQKSHKNGRTFNWNTCMIDETCTPMVVPLQAGCTVVNLGGRSPNFDISRCVLFEEGAGGSSAEAYALVAERPACSCAAGGVGADATCGNNARTCVVPTATTTTTTTTAGGTGGVSTTAGPAGASTTGDGGASPTPAAAPTAAPGPPGSPASASSNADASDDDSTDSSPVFLIVTLLLSLVLVLSCCLFIWCMARERKKRAAIVGAAPRSRGPSRRVSRAYH
jgi:hypothetical protein